MPTHEKMNIERQHISRTRKRFIGRVVRVSNAQTVVVLVESRKAHPLYRKIMRTQKKFLVDTKRDHHVNDIVIIEQRRPVSKRKHWQIIESQETGKAP